MRTDYTIGIIPGDGIGKDVIDAAMVVLKTVNALPNTPDLKFLEMDSGETALKKYGNPFPQETLDGIAKTDAVLFGAAGDPHTVAVLGGFRRGFDLYAKACPIKSMPNSNALQPKADLIIVRENSEGLFRRLGYIDRGHYVNLRVFTQKGMERIIRFCFELALKENREKVTFTHKAHVLTFTDAPMRELFHEIGQEYPGVEAEDMTIDACAMQIILKPERFDIILAESSNGDILSDVGAGICGGLGFAASGNIGADMAVFEPIHGTAPKYAGKDVVNPMAAIMAGKMLFDYLGETDIASRIERAVIDVLTSGKVRTYDLGGTSSTTEVAVEISDRIREGKM
jgi:isocitrate/isopropylmalate dehydrogenase